MKSVIVLLFCLAAVRLPALPAFPGAEGAGANALGGRGGSVYHVTNLNNSGAGSLRDAVSAANRTVVFDVSGTITLASDLAVTKSNLTIAGQTAPGDGIAVKGWTFSVQNTHDVVVRYLRCRPGDINGTSFQGDSFDFVNATNVIADHISATWSVDECLSPTHFENATVQWCLIGESMNKSVHVKGPHGYGSLIKYTDKMVTFHHNLYAHNMSRNPRPGSSVKLDFVNNVVYDWGGFCGYNGDDSTEEIAVGGLFFTNTINYVSNCFVTGPNTGTSHQSNAFDSGVTNALQCRIFQAGNYMDSNRNTSLDGAEGGASLFTGLYTALASRYPALPQTTMDKPTTAYERVLAFVGASLSRDVADERIVRTVRSHNGKIIDAISTFAFPGDYITNTIYYTNVVSGTNRVTFTNYIAVNPWPALNSTPAPPDTDQDGMPDYWELNLGLNPAVTNNNHFNASGYTDLEDYLNFLGAAHTFGAVNNTNYTDLRVMTGNDTNFVFTVASATNGSVSLAADGINARFLPATNFIGLAYFTFSATNPVNHSWFGPVLVATFVTNLPPIIVAQPANSTNTAGSTAQFSVGAANANLAYRWRRSGTNLLNGGNISGATNATLVISNVGAADATNYTVVVTNFSGAITSSPAALVIPAANTPPALAAIFDRTEFAGVTVTFTNTASDTDSPPQTLTFSSENFPSGASVNSSNGIFNWRPAVAQGGTTNALKIIVTDNGSPNLSATQSFSIGVLNPAKPQMLNSIFSNGAFRLTFSGDAGPDYIVQSATNLAATNWPTLFATNPAALPFSWADTAATNFPQRFYRIQLGP